MPACSTSSCAAAPGGWRSSTWAISSSRCREGRRQPPDDSRHFGLVVDDMDEVRAALEREGLQILPGRGLDFLDPWGNRFQVVDYRDIQFERTPGVKRKLGIEAVGKSPSAQARDPRPRPQLIVPSR